MFLLLPPQPPRVFSIRGLRLYFPELEPWVVRSARSPAVPASLSKHECGASGSASHLLVGSASCSLACPIPQSHWVHKPAPWLESSPSSCPCLPLLPVWKNVSSLTPWLSDFHTVRFSVSSGCFLFLNCCPSLGCARRHSVSTYASILAGSPILLATFRHTIQCYYYY